MPTAPTIRRSSASGTPWIAGLLAALFLASTAGAAAQEAHEHDGGDTHEPGGHGHAGLHFTHPMIAESVSPDRKLRFDHRYFEFPDGATENSGVLEAEFAFHRSFSVEFGLPYTYTEAELGNLEAKLKFANFAFENAGVLLGYGVGFVIPTNGSTETPDARSLEGRAPPRPTVAARVPGELSSGDPSRPTTSPPGPRLSAGGAGVEGSLGTEEWELEPFLSFGYKQGSWELVGWTIFGIPFHQEEQAEVAAELSWNVSALLHASSRIQALLELGGSGGISGELVGEDVIFASPGLRMKPLPGEPLWVGTTVGFPLATGVDEDPFDLRWKTSLFWHFPM